MKYKILNAKIQPIPSLGKEKKVLGLQDEQGNMLVADMWSDFPTYALAVVGTEVEGILTPAKDPKYNPTLRAPSSGAPRRPSNSLAIGLAQDKKIEGIKQAQENKENSIRIASSFRDATLIVTAAYADEIMKRPVEERGEFIKKIHSEVRDWYISAWDNEDGTRQPPF